jgi:extradiol dioxygenase family protein
MIEAGAPGFEVLAPPVGVSEDLALLQAPKGTITFFYYQDLGEAAAFYRDVIGLRSVMESDWCVIFDLNPGARLGLVNATAGSQRPILGRNKGAILSLQIDDVEACLERLKRQGLAPASACLAEGCAGRTREYKIQDPEGYTVEFFAWVDQQAAYST